MEESDSAKMVEWFQSLTFTERREKIKSMKTFFTENTSQLIKTVRNLEKVEDCPNDIILGAKALIANNMSMMNTLESIEKGVDDAEKESNAQAVESGTTASGE